MFCIAAHCILRLVDLNTTSLPQEVLHDLLQLQNLMADLILKFLSLFYLRCRAVSKVFVL